ncbi:hypothetical protein FQ192_30995 [Pseudomonas sp. ANT_J12]|uniref:Uncharacterized protein n=1 Tax=Pseudomonas prosekii TaxID=1148509 RepID=A0A2U2D065_9PSED|nr:MULTISPECIES: hypothetical protein [Pseudomonas]KAA0982636.1 hypothetical protein FQ192_30995 [Pseudomonas sp. ANT_J12]PWE38603.1 hypothetical protein C9I49_27765 [Pseudomonas prosekii]
MKILSVPEFQTLIANKGWCHENSTEILAETDDMVYGWGRVSSKFAGLEITYDETYSYLLGDKSSFNSGTEGLDNPIVLTNFNVIDEHGDTIDQWNLHTILHYNFYDVDYREIRASIEVDQ